MGRLEDELKEILREKRFTGAKRRKTTKKDSAQKLLETILRLTETMADEALEFSKVLSPHLPDIIKGMPEGDIVKITPILASVYRHFGIPDSLFFIFFLGVAYERHSR